MAPRRDAILLIIRKRSCLIVKTALDASFLLRRYY